MTDTLKEQAICKLKELSRLSNHRQCLTNKLMTMSSLDYITLNRILENYLSKWGAGSALPKWLNGKRNPSPDFCTLISIALGFSLDSANELMQFSGHQPYNPRRPYEAAAIHAISNHTSPQETMLAYSQGCSIVADMFEKEKIRIRRSFNRCKRLESSTSSASTKAMLEDIETNIPIEEFYQKYANHFYYSRRSTGFIITALWKGTTKETFIRGFNKTFRPIVNSLPINKLFTEEKQLSREIFALLLFYGLNKEFVNNTKIETESCSILTSVNSSLVRCGFMPISPLEKIVAMNNVHFFDVFFALLVAYTQPRLMDYVCGDKPQFFTSFLKTTIPTDDNEALHNLIYEKNSIHRYSSPMSLKATSLPLVTTLERNKIECPKLKKGVTFFSERWMLKVEQILPSGGTSYLYKVSRTTENNNVQYFLLKEFLPTDFRKYAFRTTGKKENWEIVVDANHNQRFTLLKEQFLECCKTHQKACTNGNMHILCQYDVFEENGTVYALYQYLEGTSLEKYINDIDYKDLPGELSSRDKIGTKMHSSFGAYDSTLYANISLKRSLSIILRMAEALEPIHEAGHLHLDICTDNAYVLKTIVGGEPQVILLDYGSLVPIGSNISTSKQVYYFRNDYASTTLFDVEYNSEHKFTPDMDIYSITAILYRLIFGATHDSGDLHGIINTKQWESAFHVIYKDGYLACRFRIPNKAFIVIQQIFKTWMSTVTGNERTVYVPGVDKVDTLKPLESIKEFQREIKYAIHCCNSYYTFNNYLPMRNPAYVDHVELEYPKGFISFVHNEWLYHNKLNRIQTCYVYSTKVGSGKTEFAIEYAHCYADEFDEVAYLTRDLNGCEVYIPGEYRTTDLSTSAAHSGLIGENALKRLSNTQQKILVVIDDLKDDFLPTGFNDNISFLLIGRKKLDNGAFKELFLSFELPEPSLEEKKKLIPDLPKNLYHISNLRQLFFLNKICDALKCHNHLNQLTTEQALAFMCNAFHRIIEPNHKNRIKNILANLWSYYNQINLQSDFFNASNANISDDDLELAKLYGIVQTEWFLLTGYTHIPTNSTHSLANNTYIRLMCTPEVFGDTNPFNLHN